MKPREGARVLYNPDGTDRRWQGEITAVHNDSTVNAVFFDEEGVRMEKPDIHYCAPGEKCEVSMCEAAQKSKKGKPTAEEIAEIAADAAEEAVEEAIEELLDEGKTNDA